MKKIFIIILVFFAIGGYIIYSGLSTDFGNVGETTNFVKELFKWVFQVGKSTAKTVGYASTQDWIPKLNITNYTE